METRSGQVGYSGSDHRRLAGPMQCPQWGKVRCTRTFTRILNGKYVQLLARWEFGAQVHEETAIYGIAGGKLSFWSFTSDGKRSEGTIADGRDVDPEAIAFEGPNACGSRPDDPRAERRGRIQLGRGGRDEKGLEAVRQNTSTFLSNLDIEHGTTSALRLTPQCAVGKY